MAFSLRLITSNLLARSFHLSRVLSINRSYATRSKNDLYEQSWPRLLCPEISSMSFEMLMTDEYLALLLDIPATDVRPMLEYGWEDLVASKLPCLALYLPRLTKEGMRACADQQDTFIQGIKLPNKTSTSDIMANIIANMVAGFREITVKRSWLYYDMFFDRSILGKGLCPVIAMLFPVNSFSIYKEETSERLAIKMNMRELQKMKLTVQGLCVSVDMDGLERGDVKTFFDYDTFFIEGKTKNEHYITGIHLPEGIHKKHNMIKRKMKDGTFYATIACYVKKEQLGEIEDEIDVIRNKRMIAS